MGKKPEASGKKKKTTERVEIWIHITTDFAHKLYKLCLRTETKNTIPSDTQENCILVWERPSNLMKVNIPLLFKVR